MSVKGTIRFEDLGEPVQRLLKSLKGGYSEEDMALLEYVSVKDMAKIYGEMSTDRHAEEIWAELRASLEARRERAARRELEWLDKQRAIDSARAAEETARAAQDAADAAEETAQRERRAERRAARRAEQEAALLAEQEAALLAEQEAAEAAELEAAQREREDRRRRRRAARERELQEEADALAAEKARHRPPPSASQRREWEKYVANHPLEFGGEAPQEIQQQRVEHTLKAPPQATRDLLNRTYTPKCPNCATRFVAPPPEWDCPICLRRLRQHIKVWQPDDSTNTCMICQLTIGRFSRHHCRNCGRLVCNQCSDTKASIPTLGFKGIVKVCDDCAKMSSS